MKSKMKSSINIFSSICRMTQPQLKNFVTKRLSSLDYVPVIGDGYVYAAGEVPVLLVAHMDTVHKEKCNSIIQVYDHDLDKTGLASPQGIGGDDRCGIYMIFEVLKELKCSVLFTEDEEIGGIGAHKFTKAKIVPKVNYIIEFDRKGSNDAVFYECENPDFTKFICDGFYEEAYGSFSDISYVAPYLKVAAVNLSCGYYEAHTSDEYVIMEEMLESIKQAKRIIRKECKEPFEYIEKEWGYDYDYDYYGWGYGSLSKKYGSSNEINGVEIFYYDPVTKMDKADYIVGISVEECLGKFFIENSDVCFNDIYDYEIY